MFCCYFFLTSIANTDVRTWFAILLHYTLKAGFLPNFCCRVQILNIERSTQIIQKCFGYGGNEHGSSDHYIYITWSAFIEIVYCTKINLYFSNQSLIKLSTSVIISFLWIFLNAFNASVHQLSVEFSISRLKWSHCCAISGVNNPSIDICCKYKK